MMADLFQLGQAIEGSKILGSSRNPLKSRGLTNYNGIRCYRFEAKFNVKSQIDVPLDSETVIRIEPSASIEPADKIVCDKAFIHSMKPNYSTEVATGSATHQANFWRFPKQTSTTISLPHQELVNAFQNAKNAKAIADDSPKNLLTFPNKY